MPSLMLIGVEKCGTNDFYVRAIRHPNIFSTLNKAVFFWSKYRFEINATLGDYMDLFDRSLQRFLDNLTTESYGDAPLPYISLEYDSSEFTQNNFWGNHPQNYGLKEPKYLNANDIYATNPGLKLIVLLRNPTSRLYSSYFMYKKGRNPEDFHSRVVASIALWKKCTEVLGLPLRRCIYGCPSEFSDFVCESAWKDQNHK